MLIRMNKAFHTMDHHVLLDKLNYYGFRGIINQWFFSYLANRAQTTEIDFYLSHKQNVTCGVPQGSVLGSLLVLLTSFTLMKILRHWSQLQIQNCTIFLIG